MKRAKKIARIKRMLDRALASEHEPEDCLRVHGAMLIDEDCADRFQFDGWSNEAIYALVMAFAEQAPPGRLARMARAADLEYREIEAFDAVDWYEGQDLTPLFSSYAEAQRWAS